MEFRGQRFQNGFQIAVLLPAEADLWIKSWRLAGTS